MATITVKPVKPEEIQSFLQDATKRSNLHVFNKTVYVEVTLFEHLIIDPAKALWQIPKSALQTGFNVFSQAAFYIWNILFHSGAQRPTNKGAYSNADMKAVWQQTESVLKQGTYKCRGKTVDTRHKVGEAVKSTVKQGVFAWHSVFKPKSPTTTKYSVVSQDALECAIALKKQGKNPVLLNPANALTPGGGYKNGARAMEEDICRRSGLSSAIDESNGEQENFYPLSNSELLYTKDVPIFREGRNGQYRYLPAPVGISMLTSAAIDLGHEIKKDTFVKETKNRIYAQLWKAAQEGHDALVLTAFGCGAFKNSPKAMANLYKEVIDTYFKDCFSNITFAIIDDHNTRQWHNPDGNFRPFYDVFVPKK